MKKPTPPGRRSRRAAGAPRRLALLAAAAMIAAAQRVMATPPASAASLFPGALIGTGASPLAPVVADFNGDGIDDVAVANRDSDDVSVVLGRGDGSFAAQERLPAGPAPGTLVSADFDGDGHADLAVGDTGALMLFPGRGDGTFAEAVSVPGLEEPSGLVAADLDGDGRPDLVIADAASHRVVVLLGHGDGTFSSLDSFDPGVTPKAIAVADLDRDGRADLVVAGGFRVAVLPGRGDGTFGSPSSGVTPTDAIAMAVADVDGDGWPDVVLGGRGDDCDLPQAPGLVVLRGTGDGGLSLLRILEAAGAVVHVALADFDGDGAIDVVAVRVECDAEGRGTIAVYRGGGDGTFAAPLRSAAGYFPGGVAVGDFNRDHLPDAVVSNGGANYAGVFLGTGDGRFRPRAPEPAAYGVGDAPAAIVIADFDGDGRPDLGTADDFSHEVSVLMSAGAGQYADPSAYPVGRFPQSLLAADLDGDGRVDLVADDHLLFGQAGGRFSAGPALPAGYRPLAVAAADLNGDGRPDLAIADAGDFGTIEGAVAVFLNAGGGEFLKADSLEAGESPVAVVMDDFDRDGHVDLISADAFTTDLRLFRGRGDGTFAPASTVAVGLWARVLLAGDVNGDAVPDLLAAGFEAVGEGGSVAVMLGHGDGGFDPARRLVAGPSTLGLAAGDLDADGDLDLVATNYDADTVTILRNQGDGSFAAQEVVFAGDAPGAVAIADLDGDGRNDLAVADYDIPGKVSLLFNTGPFPNRAPRAVAVAAASVECTSPSGGPVTLDGRGSVDPDSAPGTSDDIASFEWFEDRGLESQHLLARGALVDVTLPLGSHALTLVVTDRAGAVGTDAVMVHVVDTQPPRLALRTVPALLWPPNHRMRDVRVAYEAGDACGPVAIVLESIESSEPDDAPGSGDGATVGDIAGAAVGTPDFDVSLRAEREDIGPGRLYTLTYRARDASGNSATATATVVVPAGSGRAAAAPRGVRGRRGFGQ